MKFRKFGSLDWHVSVLGMGIQKLPAAVNPQTEHVRSQSIRLLRYAIDAGQNYIDMGYPYQNDTQDRLRAIVGKSLEDGYRERVRISTVLPIDVIHTQADVDRFIQEALDKLNITKIDFITLGRLDRDNIHRLFELQVFKYVEEAVSKGVIDHVGFSFHDHLQTLKKVIDMYDGWSFCQVQYSYMDVDHDPGISGIRYAAEKGLGVVVTQPLRDGRLTNITNEAIVKLWKQAPVGKSYQEWGLNFAWNDPGVSVVVTDVETHEQLLRFLPIAESAEPNNMSIREELLINRVRDAYEELKEIPCPSCRACMPCPVGIDVPRIFEIYNDSCIYSDLETARRIYFEERHNGAACTECDLCTQRCAKQLDVVGMLGKADRRLGRQNEPVTHNRSSSNPSLSGFSEWRQTI